MRMYQLNINEYEKVLPIYKNSKYQIPMMQSVIERKLNGRIFADNKNNSKAFIIITHFNWFYVIGNQESETFKMQFNDFANEQLISENEHFAWLGLNEYWQVKLKEIYNENVISFPRVKFIYDRKNELELSRNSFLSSEYIIKKVDRDLIEKASLFFDGIKMFWGNNENFLENSIGFCVIYKNQIVSICQSLAIIDGVCELDVFTAEGHRGCQLGYHTCRAFIEYCQEIGLKPYWETVRANHASYKLAGKLGFREAEEYPFYAWFKKV